MFYPIESLKKGGRFYICWVADAWPFRFATITRRQLSSYDIREICDDLLQVMASESGRPTNRFSLRLSSQLMRGLARLYQRKVSVLLGDLCMVHASVLKHTNKKWNIQEVPSSSRNIRQQLQPLVVLEEPQEQAEELIQDQSTVVRNIQDITLNEPTIPRYQLLQNDGFGEEHPNQALQQLLTDGSIEQMLAAAESSMQHSALGAVLETSDKSYDRTRLAAQDTILMERISEHDVLLLRKSAGGELVPEDTIKDIYADISRTSETRLPRQRNETLISPIDEACAELEQAQKEIPEKALEGIVGSASNRQEEEIELEELEEPQVLVKRRRNKLISDKHTQISSDVFRGRVANVAVELRCQGPLQDKFDMKIPADIYLNRPAHAGIRLRSIIALTLTRLFARNLGIVHTHTGLAESEIQPVEQPRQAVSVEKSVEVEPTFAPIHVESTLEQISEPVGVQLETSKERMLDQSAMEQTIVEPRVTDELGFKRPSSGPIVSPKRSRPCGYMSYKPSEQRNIEMPTTSKEIDVQVHTAEDTNKTLTELLQEAGLAEMEEQTATLVTQRRKRKSREDSETPLGSLDRTLVSLGDSDKLTDSQRFLRNQWGPEGTIFKIIKCISDGVSPLTVKELVANGPIGANSKRVVAARCFFSILKLKQHGFINVSKEPDTNAITNITLGQRCINRRDSNAP